MNNVLTVDKYNLEYKYIEPSTAERQTIIFLHEGLGCVGMWKDFPQQVVEATGCGALVYSRAGYGNSDPVDLPRPTNFMHYEALVVLPQVIKYFQIRDAVLFGHSDGGSISLIHAGGIRPNNVRALILEAPHVFVEDLSIESIELARDNYEKGTLKESLGRYHGNNVECAFRGWNDVWLSNEFRSWNIQSYLPDITVPVLVIQGEDDQYGTIVQVEAIARGCGGPVESVILPKCAHSPHRDQPERVIESVVTFLDRTIC